MKINLEEAACIAMAVLLLIASVTAQVFVAPAMVENWEMPEFLAVTLNACIISFAGLYGVPKIPSSWYFKIVYESKDDENNDKDDLSTIGDAGLLHQ